MKRAKENKMSELELEEAFSIAQKMAETLTGELPEEEKQVLNEWCVAESHSCLYHRLLDEEHRKWKKTVFQSFDKEEGWENYRHKWVNRHRKFYLRMVEYAALLLLPLGITFFFYIQRSPVSVELPVAVAPVIYPGGNRAVLTLADGKKVDLEQQKGLIAPNAEGIIVYNRENQLSYQDSLPESQPEEIKYNEVLVPRCGEFQLKLSDGTLVYLNSVTRIRYPVRFAKEKREVELEGEAYFKVAKNRERPFVIKTSSYEVKVLGTQFNISTYPEEEVSRTTLVEGEVMIRAERGKEYHLKPNERFSWNKATSKIQIQTVDVNDDIAWKDAKFRFRDIRLEDIMRVIERWYGVKVVYEDQVVKDFRFGFNIGRHETIEPLLRIFELNGKVKILQEGKILKIKRGR